MFGLYFPPEHMIDEQHLEAVRKTITDIVASAQHGGNRAANQTFVDNIHLQARVEQNEAYWGEALDYHFGLLYAHVGDPEKAAHHFDRSGTYPAYGGNQLFSDHQRDSLDLFRRQTMARERGMPSPVIASMPRSASASLTQTLASMLDAPLLRVSCGRFPAFSLVPRWLNCFTPGGAILHDHFGATAFNLKTLHECNVHQVFVRARDPRPAAASSLSLSNLRYGTSNDVDFERQMIDLCEGQFIPWAAAWLAAATDPTSNLKIHWLLRPAGSTGAMVREVLTTLAPEYPALEPYLAKDFAEVRANFVTGDKDDWRKRISQSGQERLWNAISQPLKDVLGLQR